MVEGFRGQSGFATFGMPLHCDFYAPDWRLIIEYDERQHFTAPRAEALSLYPDGLPLGFQRDEWISACRAIKAHDRMVNKHSAGYTLTMKKTTLQIDEELVSRAREILQTKGLQATVQRALEEVLALDARRRAIEQLRHLDGLDLDQPEIRAEAWR